MKAFSKLLVLVLILGVLVGAVFAIGAFADEGTGANVTYEIPEGNDDTFLLFNAKTGEFIRTLKNVRKIEVLPYHAMGAAKWEALGMEYRLGDAPSPDSAAIDRARAAIGPIRM